MLGICIRLFHLDAAEDVNTDLLDAIKAAFKSKPITIIVEEDEGGYELTEKLKGILDERLQEDERNYISANDSVDRLKKKPIKPSNPIR